MKKRGIDFWKSDFKEFGFEENQEILLVDCHRLLNGPPVDGWFFSTQQEECKTKLIMFMRF